MAKTIRIVVVGAGLIGRRHIQYVIDEARCTLVAVVDPDPDTVPVAEAAGVPHFTDIDHFLDATTDAEPADAAIIATPNQTHAAIGNRCVQAGLHLLVEKPIDTDPGAAARLIDNVREHGTCLNVCHHRRFNPYVQAVKKLLGTGQLGRVAAVNVLWALKKPATYFQVAPWRGEPGGGPVLINFVHDIDTLRYWFGDIKQVYAEVGSTVRNLPVEDTAVVTLKFTNGLLATALISDTAPSPYAFELATGENPTVQAYTQDCYRLFGSKGVLSFPDMTLWSYESGKEGWEHPLKSQTIEVQWCVPLKEQLRHFCDVVQRLATPRCSGDEALKTLQATLAVRASALSGVPVCL